MRWRVRMKSKMRTMSLAAAAALCATVGFADVTFGGKWYEAAADKYGVTLVGWKQFYMGANIAIPVTVTDANGESVALTSADITIKPGTYIDYGTPRIVSEANMWAKYGQSIQDVFNAGSRIDLEKDGGAVPVPDYRDINVSDKVVKIIQSYTGVVNKMVWRKDG